MLAITYKTLRFPNRNLGRPSLPKKEKMSYTKRLEVLESKTPNLKRKAITSLLVCAVMARKQTRERWKRSIDHCIKIDLNWLHKEVILTKKTSVLSKLTDLLKIFYNFHYFTISFSCSKTLPSAIHKLAFICHYYQKLAEIDCSELGPSVAFFFRVYR